MFTLPVSDSLTGTPMLFELSLTKNESAVVFAVNVCGDSVRSWPLSESKSSKPGESVFWPSPKSNRTNYKYCNLNYAHSYIFMYTLVVQKCLSSNRIQLRIKTIGYVAYKSKYLILKHWFKFICTFYVLIFLIISCIIFIDINF